MIHRRVCLWAIALNACVSSGVPVYTINSDLVAAVNTCLVASPVGACSPAIGTWDVSAITDMSCLFMSTSSFNTDISPWNVGAVMNMNSMFASATAFNQPLGAWNFSNVNEMRRMFSGAVAFNQPIGMWNVGAVTDMMQMFASASAFNQPIGLWDVSRVTEMHVMFMGASAFNQDMKLWDVSHVINMNKMFRLTPQFNMDLSVWDVGMVTNFNSMFDESAFNCTLCSPVWLAKSSLLLGAFGSFAGSVCSALPPPSLPPPLSPPPFLPPPPLTTMAAIEAACRALLGGASNAVVSVIDANSFLVTVTLDSLSVLSVSDAVTTISDPVFVIGISSSVGRPVFLFLVSSHSLLLSVLHRLRRPRRPRLRRRPFRRRHRHRRWLSPSRMLAVLFSAVACQMWW